MKSEQLTAPFPYFGGKSQVAQAIWSALGDVDLYAEPFLGSAAVLLARPHAPRREIAGDANAFIINFWRAVQRDPKAVARACRGPAHDLEMLARHRWLCEHARKKELIGRITEDVDYFDARIAGYWAWIMSVWIGSGVCEGSWYGPDDPRNIGTCIHGPKRARSVPSGIFSRRRREKIPELLTRLAERLAQVTFLCVDWSRLIAPSDFKHDSMIGVYLDPPYDHDVGRDKKIYLREKSSTRDVEDWCRTHGTMKNVRIVLSGFEGEYNLPGWRKITWNKKFVGFATTTTGRANAMRERLWLSPHCEAIALDRRVVESSDAEKDLFSCVKIAGR